METACGAAPGTCTNVMTDPFNCGTCANACPVPTNSAAACGGGHCGFICNSGYADCDRSSVNGCEIQTQTDTTNCGSCGNVCSLAHATAIRGPAPKVKGDDDAGEAAWLDAFRPPELAFDHAAILEAARRWLVRGLEEGLVALALLPRQFGSAQIQALHRAVDRPARAAASWAARMKRQGRIVPVPGASGSFQAAGRPPRSASRSARSAGKSSRKKAAERPM